MTICSRSDPNSQQSPRTTPFANRSVLVTPLRAELREAGAHRLPCPVHAGAQQTLCEDLLNESSEAGTIIPILQMATESREIRTRTHSHLAARGRAGTGAGGSGLRAYSHNLCARRGCDKVQALIKWRPGKMCLAA